MITFSLFPPLDFPWGVCVVLGIGLIFTAWCIYYILRLAYEEMKNDPHNH